MTVGDGTLEWSNCHEKAKPRDAREFGRPIPISSVTFVTKLSPLLGFEGKERRHACAAAGRRKGSSDVVTSVTASHSRYSAGDPELRFFLAWGCVPQISDLRVGVRISARSLRSDGASRQTCRLRQARRLPRLTPENPFQGAGSQCCWPFLRAVTLVSAG